MTHATVQRMSALQSAGGGAGPLRVSRPIVALGILFEPFDPRVYWFQVSAHRIDLKLSVSWLSSLFPCLCAVNLRHLTACEWQAIVLARRTVFVAVSLVGDPRDRYLSFTCEPARSPSLRP